MQVRLKNALSPLAHLLPCSYSKRAPEFDVDAVVEFIETYIKEDRTNATSIDRVGEYLKEEDLSHPSVGVPIVKTDQFLDVRIFAWLCLFIPVTARLLYL